MYDDKSEDNYESKDYDTDKYNNILSKALERANRYQSDDYYQRSRSMKDIRFCTIPGEQWSDDRLNQEFKNKPKLEFNLIHQIIMDSINSYLRNNMSVVFSPLNGTDGRDICDIAQKLYRSDFYYSNGNLAKLNAYKEASKGGMGAWRLTCKEEDEYSDNDYQRICFEPIYSASSMVFFDSDSKKQDKSDSKYCFVIHSITPDRAKEEYGFIPTPFPYAQYNSSIYNSFFTSPDVTYIAEYYICEDEEYKCYIYKDFMGNEYIYEEDEFDDLDEFELIGKKKFKEKKKKRRRVHKYILSGNKVLEDCGRIAGSEIPIIPVYGYYDWIDNSERFMGVGTLATDACKLINMNGSKLALLSASSPTKVPILFPEQVEGLKQVWARQNVNNYPYVLLNPIKDRQGNIVQPLGPVGQVDPPDIPPATLGSIDFANGMVDKILGRRDIAEDIKPDISGVALKRIQKNFDMKFYVLLENMKIAIARCGKVWLSMASEVYIEEDRRMKTIETDGMNYSSINLGEMVLNEDTGVLEKKYDFKKFKLDASVQVGYSSETEKEAVIESLISMLQVAATPEQKDIITSAILMNLTGEGLNGINNYYRMKLVRAGVEEPTEKERIKLQQEILSQKPTSEQKYLESEAQKSMAQAEKYKADAGLAVAKSIEIASKAKKNEAQTAKELLDLYR